MIAEGSPNSPANRRHASAHRRAPDHLAQGRRSARSGSTGRDLSLILGAWPSATHLLRDAAELARLGGKARAKKLTAEQRREIARKAARARWGKAKRAQRVR
jgi:hypothetical protein